VGQAPEQVDVEAFVAQATVEGLDEGVAPRLPGWDEQHPGPHPVQFGGEHFAGDGALDQPAEKFTGVLVNHRQDLDRPTVGGRVELEVDGPHHVRAGRGRHRRHRGGPDPLAATLHDHAEAFLAPQPLDLSCG
jgi:hypothetical protein